MVFLISRITGDDRQKAVTKILTAFFFSWSKFTAVLPSLEGGDWCRFLFLSDYRDMEVTPLVANFESTLTSLLDTHAPTKKRTIILRPHAPWYKDSIHVEKKKRRKLERRWGKSGLFIDWELYITQCGVTNDMIKNAKFNHYSSIITENKGNQKVLSKTTDQLLHRNQNPVILHHHLMNNLNFMRRYLRYALPCQLNLIL